MSLLIFIAVEWMGKETAERIGSLLSCRGSRVTCARLRMARAISCHAAGADAGLLRTYNWQKKKKKKKKKKNGQTISHFDSAAEKEITSFLPGLDPTAVTFPPPFRRIGKCNSLCNKIKFEFQNNRKRGEQVAQRDVSTDE